jgi:signal transduction histidine kinase
LIPIRLADKMLGLIHLTDARTDMFSPEMIAILEGAAMQLGTGIERVRAEEALQKSHGELEQRVADRTARLVSANELLNNEIIERILSENKLLEQRKKLRSLSSELLLTEERERRRIATELHDRIGQTLAMAKIKLGELGEVLPAGAAVDVLADIREFIEQTIQDTRSLTFELSPPILYELGLEAALAWLVNQTRKKHGLRIELKDDGRAKPLDISHRVILFQTTRELVFNIIKHARAQEATVSVRKDDDAVRIDIEDDGIGFNASELESCDTGSMGYGLFSVRERLDSLGARIEIHSEPGSGTRVAIVLPLA